MWSDYSDTFTPGKSIWVTRITNEERGIDYDGMVTSEIIVPTDGDTVCIRWMSPILTAGRKVTKYEGEIQSCSSIATT